MRHDDNRKPWISPTRSETLSMPGSYLSRSWEVSSVPDGVLSGGTGKGNRNPVIYADEKSDIPIVPKKLPNNGCFCPAEVMEGRGIATGKAVDAPACRTQSRVSASMGLEGLRERAKQQRRANMNIVASSPAAGAVCGNSARTDLCGGRRVTVVPTATHGCFQEITVVCPRLVL